MPQNFLACDREQELLLPPSLREWLPDDHLAWFVIDAVAAIDLIAFYAPYRADGHGRAAHDPAMMVALLLYAYAIGERSSRAIERRCVEDVAVRVICANQWPDHTTIARFRQRHEAATAGLFGEVLTLCGEVGMVQVGVVAIDGTKVHVNASQHATRSYEEIAREILAEADAVDAAEDGQFGERRGDELPSELATAQGRHQAQMEGITGRGSVVLIPPDAGKRKGTRPGWDGGRYAFMRRVLASDRGGELYAKRQGMIEPVFAHTKFNRRMDRFQRRGRWPSAPNGGSGPPPTTCSSSTRHLTAAAGA
jgi:transposase